MSKQTTARCKWPLIISLLITLSALTTGGNWLFTSTSGLQWLLSTVSRVSSGKVAFEGVQGSFTAIRLDSVSFSSDDLQLTIRNFTFDWQPNKLFSSQLIINALSARAVNVISRPSSEPSSLPKSLRLPLSLSIQTLNIASLRLYTTNDASPYFTTTDIVGQLTSDGQQHHLSNLQLNSKFGVLNTSAQISGEKPFDLKAQVKLVGLTRIAGSELPATSIASSITGDLSQLDLNISIKGDVLNGGGEALIHPFAPFPITALRLSIAGFNPNTFLPDKNSANLTLRTDLRENTEKQLAGNLVIKNSTAGQLDSGSLPLTEARAYLRISPDLLQLDDFLLRLTDSGVIAGNVSWNTTQSSGLADLTIKQLNPLALDGRLQPAKIDGSIKLTGDTKKQQGTVALKDDTLNLDAKITHIDELITLESLQLRRHQSALTASGKFDLDAQQSFDLRGKLTHFNIADFIQAPHSDLNIALNLAGKLTPNITGSVNFKFKDSKLDNQPVSGNGSVKFDSLKQVKGKIDLCIGSNTLLIRGGFGKPGDKLKLDIAAPALAQIGMGIDGAVNLHASLAGSFKSPQIRFEVTGDNLTLPNDQYLASISGDGHLHDEVVSLNMNADDYQTDKKTQLQHLKIAITGHKSDHTIVVKTQINDEIEANLFAAGRLIKSTQLNPALQWQGEITQLSATGPLPFDLMAATKLDLSQTRVSLGTTRLAVAGGQLSINDTLWMPQKWHSQGEFTGISLRPGDNSEKTLQTLQLGGEWNITSATHLTGNLHISREKGDWVLPGELPLSLGLQTLQLTGQASQGNLSANLAIKGERIGVTNANITLPLTKSGASWIILPNTQLNGRMVVNVSDISWVGQAIGENLKSDGQLNLQAELAGTADKPMFQGKIDGENLAFALLDQGLQLQQGKLKAHFDQSSLRIDTLNFVAPDEPPPDDPLLGKLELTQEPGSLTIFGEIGLAGNDSNIKITLERLPLVHESNHWIIASGNTHAKFNQNTLTLDGNITADAGILMQPPADSPQLSDDIIIVSEQSSEDETQKLQLNLDANLDLGEHFYIRASGLEGRLGGRLHLKNDNQKKLKVTGSIATKDSVFEAYGQQLTVQRGIVNFNGPLDDPGLNILAIRKTAAVEAGVEVLGTVRRPRIRLVSTPNIPDSEKLSWIVFGRSLGSGGVDTSLLLTAAGSILGGQPGSQSITDKISQTLGLDEISFRQGRKGDPLFRQTGSTSSVGTTGNAFSTNSYQNHGMGSHLSGQIGTVGKRISSRAYLSYERGLTTATAGITKLTYTLTPKITIVTQAGVDSAADIFYNFQFD